MEVRLKPEGGAASLTVQLAPAQPLGFAAIDQLQTQPPAKMFQALGVKVTANPAAAK